MTAVPLSPAAHAEAVAWLRANWSTVSRPIVPAIRDHCGCGSIEAVAILREVSPHTRRDAT